MKNNYYFHKFIKYSCLASKILILQIFILCPFQTLYAKINKTYHYQFFIVIINMLFIIREDFFGGESHIFVISLKYEIFNKHM